MAGLKVVPVKTHADGNLDLEDLKFKAEKYTDNLAAFMVCNLQHTRHISYIIAHMTQRLHILRHMAFLRRACNRLDGLVLFL